MAVLSYILLALVSTAAAQDWQNGRATWFDVQDDDLRTANCHLSWDQINTGRDVGALSDGNPLFASSCGMCFEIRCQNAIFQDGYGATIDRQDACYGGQSVFVTVSDACPCNYPNNAGSNKRWCCSDDPSRTHIDITRGAFSKLADLNKGVIGIQWRVVDCKSVNSGGNSYPVSSSSSPSPSSPQSSSSQSSSAQRSNGLGSWFGWWWRG